MDEETIYQTIVKQIEEIYGVKGVDLETSINSLNGASEDNEAFLKRFQETFEVDMKGFDYYHYFHEDQFYVLSMVFLIMRLCRKSRKKPELRVQHLVDVAVNRKWSIQ
jgi:hypothetical protein